MSEENQEIKKIRELLDLQKPETYDFREQIVAFMESENAIVKDEVAIARYIIYQAIGIAEESSGCVAADEIYADYNKKEQIRIPKGEADTCPLMQEIYKKLWDEKYLQFCPQTGDTMNSCTTTVNHLIKKWIDAGCISIDKGIKKAPWSKRKTVSQYYSDHKRESKENTLKQVLNNYSGLKRYLRAVYTIGNFIPVPKGCNGPRGAGPTEDYWDLALKCICDWYGTSSKDEKLSFLAKLLNYHEKAMKNYGGWLESFGTWDDFVEYNFLQDYTEWQERPFGRPKEFWDGHFDGAPLPVTTEQFNVFFSHAVDCISARSVRMINKLRELRVNRVIE